MAFRLRPSGTDSGIEMIAILPDEGATPERALANVKLDSLLDERQPFELDLKLPKFTLDYDTKLKSSITQMGMGIAFQFPGAEFAPIGSPLFYIGDVLHKTRLGVDEKGTVAAAATAPFCSKEWCPSLKRVHCLNGRVRSSSHNTSTP